jgi:transposase
MTIVMEDTLLSLPDDPAVLKELLAARMREHDALQSRVKTLEDQKQAIEVEKLRLEAELLRLRKLYYGPRADKLLSLGDVNQLLLEFAAGLEKRPVDAADELPAIPEVKTIRRVGRRDLQAFDQLPVTRQVHDLAEAEKPCPCCGELRQKIGEESSWQIEYVPGHFERIEHVRIKYACSHCESNAENPQIVRADKPLQAIEKGMAGPGLLAYIVTSKFADYLPLYRLEGIFERNGLEISRATQSVWCSDVADLVRPLYELMVKRVVESHLVCTDDTVMPMLAPEKTRQARMWVYIGDEANPYNVFDFTLSRSRDGPAEFLKGYKQTLLADAYGGYDGVVVASGIRRAGCWAHARRKFVDAEKTQPAIAAEAVGMIQRLYAIESRGKALSVEDRRLLRQSESLPILQRFRERLETWRRELLPKHPMAQAAAYALNQWEELNVFAADGFVPIDNNISEREMKRIVLNRKNSLFVGNQRGGQTAGVLSSFTSTCRRHAINPQLYLTQLLVNLPATPLSQLHTWLPDQWKLQNPTP